jgi:catechol 2,3-dioxygenase-like lactoylglutathione lyase family enzyme
MNMVATTTTPTTTEPAQRPAELVARFDHIGIQTQDLGQSIAWYRDFFGVQPTWTLDRFSDLSKERLPGMTKLTEVRLGDLAFHLFERKGTDEEVLPGGNIAQYQHVCLTVRTAEELPQWRRLWLDLYHSGRYEFHRDELPSDVVQDDDGMLSLYLFDPNGLEFELQWMPEVTS